MERIPVSGPWITDKEITYVTDAVTRAWYADANIYHARFELAFRSYVGRRYAIALPSCTSALHLILLSLGLGPGDEVIVPDITWIATSAPVSYVGAVPVFADINPKTLCLDVQSFERNITPRTKAVIVVNLYGNMPDMGTILAVAERYGIAVIEDAAQSIGSEYKGRPAGSFGLASAFSFHGSKTLTTGEGGMLVTDHPEIYDRCLFLRDHGRRPGDTTFWNTEVGYKYHMSSMQAALGLAQLERIEDLVARKREIFAWYKEALEGVDGVTLNDEAPGIRNTYWMMTAIFDAGFGITTSDLLQSMSDSGIDCRPFFNPLSALPAYAGLPSSEIAKRSNINSYRISLYGINLPSGFNMTPESVARVCDSFTETIRAARKRFV